MEILLGLMFMRARKQNVTIMKDARYGVSDIVLLDGQ